MEMHIGRRNYNTDTGREIGSFESNDGRATLYCKQRGGEYFVYVQATSVSSLKAWAAERGRFTGTEGIVPLDPAEVESWARGHLAAEVCDAEFSGEGEKVMLGLKVRRGTKRLIEARSLQLGITQSEYLDACVSAEAHGATWPRNFS